ncbi:MAG: DUF763 domain-containing protein [Candidatus Woesearchaeota archaeon]
MQRTGMTNLPLHTGNAPPWLFKRMVRMGGAITEAIIDEYGHDEFLRRISDPYFFQSLGCVIGFDWHSSGLTTTLCGALKEGINKADVGMFIAGGKGAASRKAPGQIESASESFGITTAKSEKLVYSSRMAAKVDNSLVQDSYQLYHHCFFLTEKGKWSVVQQGLGHENSYARRYHWLSNNVKSFVEEPHSAICADKQENETLDMTSRESGDARRISVDVVNDGEFRRFFRDMKQKTLADFSSDGGLKRFSMQRSHYIKDMHQINMRTLERAYELQPKNYEGLSAVKGMGPKAIRSLALISDIVHGKKASWKDPAKFSFAHGGKDSVPYPVDRELMDRSTDMLRDAIRQARIGEKDEMKAIRKLANFI